jgi:hypothetical protein
VTTLICKVLVLAKMLIAEDSLAARSWKVHVFRIHRVKARIAALAYQRQLLLLMVLQEAVFLVLLG